MAQTVDANAFGDCRFRCVFDGQQYISNSAASGANGHRKCPANGTQTSIQRKLTYDHVIVTSANGSHSAQDGGGHGQVKTRALFANIGGRQVHGYGFTRVAKTRVKECRFDTFTALFDGGVGHADGYEISIVTSGIHIHFNVN